MKVILSPKAEKELRKLSKIDQIALAKKIRSLREEENVNEEKLKGIPILLRFAPPKAEKSGLDGFIPPKPYYKVKAKGYIRKIFRVWVGNFRIVYRKLPREIYVVLIGHRREVYEVLQ